MSTNLTAKDIKTVISKANLTMAEAARKMDMSPQNLHKHLAAEELSSHFVRLFKETFEQSTKVDTSGIPVVSGYVTAGVVDLFKEGNENIVGYVNLPEFKGCDFITKARGDSMEPTIPHNSWIGLKEIEPTSLILSGKIYVVVTEGLSTMKRIKVEADKKHWTLYSDNEAKHPSQQITKTAVIKLFIVKAMLQVQDFTF